MPISGRRLQLLEAATRVTAAGGLRRLTHRAVDAEAGVPEGSTSGYYRTRIALLTALTEYVADVMRETVEALSQRLADLGDGVRGGEQVDRLADEVVALLASFLERPDIVSVQAELALEAMRTPDLRRIFDTWRAELVEIVTGIGETVGSPEPAERAEITVGAFQGLLTTSLMRPADERAAYLEAGARRLVGLLLRP